MSDNFSWMSPQEHSGSVGRQDKFEARRQWVARNLERLKDKPGTWALVHEGSSSSNGGDVYKVLGCEVTVRANFSRDKKTLDIYARWPVATGDIEASSNVPTVFVYQQDGIDHVGSGQHKPKKRRGRPPVDVCKRGHDTTAAGARYASGNCRKCTNKKTSKENAA